MIANATMPASPVQTTLQNLVSAPKGGTQSASTQNPFDMLLGMSMSLMDFEQTLSDGATAQTGDATASPWTLATAAQEPLAATVNMMLIAKDATGTAGKTASAVKTGTDEEKTSSSSSNADAPPLLMQALAGQLNGQPVIPAPQNTQSPQTAPEAAQGANAFTGQAAAEALAAMVPATTGSTQTQGAWNLSELTQQITQALKSRQAMETSAGAEQDSAGTATKTAYDWSPSPVQDTSGNTRMPQMIEQVQQISDFLAERTEGVIKLGKDGVEANMRLYPPDLGGVRVSMTVHNGNVQAAFIVERPETAQLLQQQTQHFREMMSRHGLTVEQMRVTVSATSASSGANANYLGQSGTGQQDRQEALWERQQQQQSPDGQQPDQRNAWDETGD